MTFPVGEIQKIRLPQTVIFAQKLTLLRKGSQFHKRSEMVEHLCFRNREGRG